MLGGLLFGYALVGYVALNAFELKEMRVFTFSFKKNDWIVSLQYKYVIEEKVYNKKIDMSEDLYRKNFEIGLKGITILYYPYFPGYSDVKGLNLENRKKKPV
ncbi:MAG: hypothetical protein A3G23_11700 [Bacteroidetes bacterium RIFCSPLOWO2_12_FULL_37_12]|nr:MAG: hypothetical protein A3G23_11700 [Bacteroidetes bacterium RIFCSPLOWO2_12_FULL_37_12]